jgi:solute carrier family 26 (sodium-independent sulfate anion transporter), member 11
VRTPFAGVITAGVVLLALYTLTPVFFYVPSASLAGVIIHAVGDLVTPPGLIYHYWKISPIDVLIFFTGVIITVFDNIETGVFATIFLSVAVLLYRIFRSRGQFMGSAKVYSRIEDDNQLGQTGQTSPYSLSTSPKVAVNSELVGGRSIFLPLDRTDGSNPLVRVEEPESGIFIYKLLDGLNYQNANRHLDHMVALIYAQTRPTTTIQFAKPGVSIGFLSPVRHILTNLQDRSWNDPSVQRNFRAKQSIGLEIRPTLKAVILDFSTVNNVDLTSIQVLTDVRTQLDRFASPDTVQWHFARVNNRWTKRALVAAGFGIATKNSANGGLMANPRIFDVGEMDSHENSCSSLASNPKTVGTSNWDDREQDIEMATFKSENKISGGDIIAPDEFALGKTVVLTTEYRSQTLRVAPVQGTNFPFFHVDLESALESARAIAQGGLQLSDSSGLASK